jgi:hypothetical protein
MPLDTNFSQSSSDAPQPALSYADHIIGAAIFDLNGLPREYFATEDNHNMSWVQTIFQALGLRSLLMASLQLEGFHHATIYGTEYCAIIVKQRAHYTALLISHNDLEAINERFIQWVHNFQLSDLHDNPRFQVA